jgi:hypothetical protein
MIVGVKTRFVKRANLCRIVGLTDPSKTVHKRQAGACKVITVISLTGVVTTLVHVKGLAYWPLFQRPVGQLREYHHGFTTQRQNRIGHGGQCGTGALHGADVGA